MIYTIACLEEVQGTIQLNFVKTGNKYLVGIYNKETTEYEHKTYETIEAAYKVFEKLSKAIIEGCYSYQARKEML
jgi:hypothetical protein